jgi:hypothetical protein
VDFSTIEGVDTIWIVKRNRKGGAMNFASSVGLASESVGDSVDLALKVWKLEGKDEAWDVCFRISC